MPLTLRLITTKDDLTPICEQMQPKVWAADNQMTRYTPEQLQAYLEVDKNLLLLAYDGDKIAGAAIAYELLHPAGDHSLYVHELDTHPDYRRHGVATAIMEKLMEIAKDREMTELWVGTEMENATAKSFYESLKPYEIELSVIYSYKVK